jgi:hypothetical protein
MTGCMTILARLVWSTAVLAAGWGLANGLWLSTYIERTAQARSTPVEGS